MSFQVVLELFNGVILGHNFDRILECCALVLQFVALDALLNE